MKGMPTWKALGFKTYQEYLQSEMWQDKKNLILEIAEYKCQKCGSKKNLQVHHLNYDSVGNENQHDVIVLCKNCHEKEHGGKN
jgi:5-methylcytosine-specific restriction endonuclease McrA